MKNKAEICISSETNPNPQPSASNLSSPRLLFLPARKAVLLLRPQYPSDRSLLNLVISKTVNGCKESNNSKHPTRAKTISSRAERCLSGLALTSAMEGFYSRPTLRRGCIRATTSGLTSTWTEKKSSTTMTKRSKLPMSICITLRTCQTNSPSRADRC